MRNCIFSLFANRLILFFVQFVKDFFSHFLFIHFFTAFLVISWYRESLPRQMVQKSWVRELESSSIIEQMWSISNQPISWKYKSLPITWHCLWEDRQTNQVNYLIWLDNRTGLMLVEIKLIKSFLMLDKTRKLGEI